MSQEKLIAHGANTQELVDAAKKSGINIAEIDLAKRRLFSPKIVAQHQGILGFVGIGTDVTTLNLNGITPMFDIKHPEFSRNFVDEATKLIAKIAETLKDKTLLVCGPNWKAVESITEKNKDWLPVYTFRTLAQIEKFKAIGKTLLPAFALSVRENLINEQFLEEFRTHKIWGWTVDEELRAGDLFEQGVGLITNRYQKFASVFASGQAITS